jgi:hypothetical protein
MKNNKLCERVEGHKLHIYINSDKFTNGENELCVSYDEESLAYSINLNKCENIEEGIDWFMGLIGRDTQNWFHNDIVIHWGVNTWTFYNARNVSDFTKEEIKYFDKADYDYE